MKVKLIHCISNPNGQFLSDQVKTLKGILKFEIPDIEIVPIYYNDYTPEETEISIWFINDVTSYKKMEIAKRGEAILYILNTFLFTNIEEIYETNKVFQYSTSQGNYVLFGPDAKETNTSLAQLLRERSHLPEKEQLRI